MIPDSSRSCLFILPPSPSDTNPPLGPAILAGRASELGLHVDVRDLNIEFINEFRDSAVREHYSSVGDHGKDRRLVKASASRLFRQFEIDPLEISFCPETGDPDPGMHYTFQGIQNAVERHIRTESNLARWLDNALDETNRDGWPAVIGISIMGPSQVFCSLLFLALIKRRAQRTVTVIGGSHVTLLSHLMVNGSPYLENVDVVLPGHSEEEFVDLLYRGFGARPSRLPMAEPPRPQHFTYLPLFRQKQLDLYDADSLTLPVQFTRGCSYAKCTYCTYPVVEPVATGMVFQDAVAAMQTLRRMHDVSRFSLKDSLLTVPMLTGLADAIESLGETGITWSGTTKIVKNLADHALKLSQSGLATLEFGIESIFARQQALISKKASVSLIEDVVFSMAEVGIVSVVNLMFGFPGETLEEARAQVDWALRIKRRVGPDLIDFSLNMLEVVRGSPMARDPAAYGIAGIAPWAYCYQWAGPDWCRGFISELDALEERAG